jgi:hypothetical protein
MLTVVEMVVLLRYRVAVKPVQPVAEHRQVAVAAFTALAVHWVVPVHLAAVPVYQEPVAMM